MNNNKKIIIFISVLLLLFIPSFIKIDYAFYNKLTLPFFIPSDIFFIWAWTITYISFAISITMILSINIKNKSYLKALIINYIFNISFMFVFFILKSTFLGFISSIGTFISCLFLYEETSKIKESAEKYLNFYVLLSLFSTVLSLSIYIMNH